MPLYALVQKSDDAILRYEDFTDEAPELAESKPFRWLPVVDTVPTPGPGQDLVGPVITVTETEVQRVWTISTQRVRNEIGEKNAEAMVARRIAEKRRRGDRLGAVELQIKHMEK